MRGFASDGVAVAAADVVQGERCVGKSKRGEEGVGKIEGAGGRCYIGVCEDG